MKSTKSNILNSALKLFNEQGFVNVRLQQIADEAFLSIGNMAYHYKTKEIIMEAIHENMIKEHRSLMSEMNVVPLFEYVNIYFRNLYDHQEVYRFFFTDMLEVFRAYPKIQQEHRQLIDWQKQQYRLMLDFNRNRGVFRDFLYSEQADDLSDQLWVSSHLYRNHVSLSNQNASKEHYCRQIWGLCIPIMTEQGWNEFKQLAELSLL